MTTNRAKNFTTNRTMNLNILSTYFHHHRMKNKVSYAVHVELLFFVVNRHCLRIKHRETDIFASYYIWTHREL